jgi:hypothetical protein
VAEDMAELQNPSRTIVGPMEAAFTTTTYEGWIFASTLSSHRELHG